VSGAPGSTADQQPQRADRHAGRAAALGPVSAIDRYLDQFTSSLRLPQDLVAAIRFALLGGGKRLRPLLAWHACAAAAGREGATAGEASLPAGAALELIHAFSLVHDDLPALDNDVLRRGRPTLHVHAGEAMAILAGDAMMALAFEHLARCCAPGLSAALVRELSAATNAMIAGQVYDSLGGFEPGLDGRAKLQLIHRNKTGALIRAACRMGAMCAGGEADETPALAPLTAYGEAVGLMFQVVDDLLDVEGTPEQTGKQTGKDAAAGKVTYPSVLGVEESQREVERLLNAALDSLEVLGPAAEPLRMLARYMAQRAR
jgi:geranylgeranyl diphosphate synthase, type II